jgi:hypothetical protein
MDDRADRHQHGIAAITPQRSPGCKQTCSTCAARGSGVIMSSAPRPLDRSHDSTARSDRDHADRLDHRWHRTALDALQRYPGAKRPTHKIGAGLGDLRRWQPRLL